MSIRYLSFFIASVLIFTFLVYGIISIVDPYYVNNSPVINGLNKVKPEAYRHQKAAKRSLFLTRDFDTIILGNSRTDIGFDPESKNWPDLFTNAFNFGMPGLSMEECITNFYFAEQNGRRPEKVILLVDFYDFVAPDIKNTEEIGDERIHPWVNGHFSLAAISDSLLTIRAQYTKNPAGFERSGFNPALPFKEMVKVEGHYRMAQQKNKSHIKTNYKRKKARDDSGLDMNIDLTELTRFSKYLANLKIKLYVIIPPYHLDFHIINERLGLSSFFENWKAAIVNAVNKENKNAEIWDFALINEITAETIPEIGDKTTKMKWYWEPGHFKSILGDQMVCEISKSACPVYIGQMRLPEKQSESNTFKLSNTIRKQSEDRINQLFPQNSH